jgi:hypothetical protein
MRRRDVDYTGPVVRLGIPRPPLSAPTPTHIRSMVEVMEWIPVVDADGKPLAWTRREAGRLAFTLWRLDRARVTS